MQGIQLLFLFECRLLLREVADDRGHTGHRLAQIVTGSLDLFALHLQLVDNGVLSLANGLDLFPSDTPEIEDDDHGDDVGSDHPPRQQPVSLNIDLQKALLIAHGTFSTDGLYVKGVLAATQVVERHTVGQGITVAPVFILPLHPVHELQTLALVVVAGSELHSKGVLVVAQVDAVGLVEGLWQDDSFAILMTCQDFLLANEQLCQHHAWQGILVGNALL